MDISSYVAQSLQSGILTHIDMTSDGSCNLYAVNCVGLELSITACLVAQIRPAGAALGGCMLGHIRTDGR